MGYAATQHDEASEILCDFGRSGKDRLVIKRSNHVYCGEQGQAEQPRRVSWLSNHAEYVVPSYQNDNTINTPPDSGNIVRLTIQNSTDLQDAANWADHQLYVVQRHDTEPRSAYPYNSADPALPVVDFNKFFDGESLDQEDLVL